MSRINAFPALCVMQVCMYFKMKISNTEMTSSAFVNIRSMFFTGLGLRMKTTCTRSADTICEPLEGFYCTEQKKNSCRFAVKHSECYPGQYVKQTGEYFRTQKQ